MKSPLYLVNKGAVSENIKRLRHSIGSEDRVLFAVKSFPISSFLNWVGKSVDGFDLSNLNEYQLLSRNLRARKLMSCVGPRLDSVSRHTDIAYLDKMQLGSGTGFSKQKVLGIRIDPADFLDRRQKALKSRFGLGRRELIQLNREAVFRNSQIAIHVHGVKPSYVSLASICRLMDFLVKDLGVDPNRIAHLNLGGGWYPEKIAQILPLRTQLASRGLYQGPFWIEPGMYFLSNAIYYLCTALSCGKSQSGTRIVRIDGSPSFHLEGASLRLESVNGRSPSSSERRSPLQERGFLDGGTCLEGDRLEILIPKGATITPGDRLLFSGLTAYSVAWSNSFNGIAQPQVQFI